jgi:hypothetical protein
MSDHAHTDLQPEPRGGGASLWAGVIGAPLVWAADLQVRYAIVPWVCRTGHHGALHALSVLFLAMAAAAVFLCWRDWRAAGTVVPAGADDGVVTRVRFLAALGLLTSTLFFVVIVAEALPNFFIDPCIH